MGQKRLLSSAVPLLLPVVAFAGCAAVMDAYREQTSPSSDMPIQCRFECPVPDRQDSEPARGKFHLDKFVVVDLLENREGIGSMYSANGAFDLVCEEEMSLERIVEGDLARLLAKHSVTVGGDNVGRPATRISLYVDIVETWVASRSTGLTEVKVPIEATVSLHAVLQDDTTGYVLWEAGCEGKDTRYVWYSFSRHHEESLGKAYCEGIRSFETGIGSEAFQRAIRR